MKPIKIEELSFLKNQYAASDLGTTLLDGDMGEAVFAWLVNRNRHQKTITCRSNIQDCS